MNFFHINVERSNEAGKWDEILTYTLQILSNFSAHRLEVWIESACNHSIISSHLPDGGLRGGINLLI